jgi:hypothetical protein
MGALDLVSLPARSKLRVRRAAWFRPAAGSAMNFVQVDECSVLKRSLGQVRLAVRRTASQDPLARLMSWLL